MNKQDFIRGMTSRGPGLLIMSGDNPATPKATYQTHDLLIEQLEAAGFEVWCGVGSWGGEVERSLVVKGLSWNYARQLAEDYGQQAYIWCGLLCFTDGSPSQWLTSLMVYDDEPEGDGWSWFAGIGYVVMTFGD